MRRPTTIKLLRMSRDEGGFRMVPVAVGVDFGTTNRVVAIADRSGQVQVRRFDTQVGVVEAYRSALLFFREGRPPNATLGHISGPDALLRAMDIDADHRFLQSLKTHLSSATLQDVYLLGRRFLLEELIGVLLKDILPAGIGDLPLVCGRPVVFAGERPNEALAIERLTNAYRSAGVANVDLAYEPLGAAYWYARTIRRQETVLVADFGGGTSDFSVMRFDLGGARMQAEALSHAGVGVAGDSFDFRIVDNLVSPRLGKGASYRSWQTLAVAVALLRGLRAMAQALASQRRPHPRRIASAREERRETAGDRGSHSFDRSGSGLRALPGHIQNQAAALYGGTNDFSFQGGRPGHQRRRDPRGFRDLDCGRHRADRRRDRRRPRTRRCDSRDRGLRLHDGGTSYVPAVRRLFEQRF